MWWQRQRQRHNFMHFLRNDYFSGLNFFQGWIYEFRTVYLVKFPSLFSFFCLFVVVAANSESGLTCPSLSGPECTLLNNHNVTYINIYNFSKNRLVTCFFIDCWKQFSCETLEAEIKNSHRLKILVGENFGKTFGWENFCNMSSTKYHQIKSHRYGFHNKLYENFGNIWCSNIRQGRPLNIETDSFSAARLCLAASVLEKLWMKKLW